MSRSVILHVDDLGMCHGANVAFQELAQNGLVTCGSVMVPCPWFAEMAQIAATNPSLDVGVHLTLTSEWYGYRWRPVSQVSPASGLIDGDGYFWRNVASLRPHLVVEAVEQELRAQIEWAIRSGIKPTHIDAHMAAAMLPELLDLHVRLALEYGLAAALPRAIRFAPDAQAYARTIARLDALGLPVADHFRATLAVPEHETEAGYHAMVNELPEGVTHIALHCTAPGEIEVISPKHTGWRTREYALFASGVVRRWCDLSAITPIGYRPFQQAWQVAGGAATDQYNRLVENGSDA